MPTSVMAAPLRPGCAAGWCRRVTEVPLATVEVYDATVFSASRTAFLGAWIGSPGHIGRALVRDGGPAGWGVTGPCRKGRKIGPLVADDRATAEVVLSALLASVGGGEIFLDVPSINRDAVALAQDLGLTPLFETARMYRGRSRRCGWSGYSASLPLSSGSGRWSAEARSGNSLLVVALQPARILAAKGRPRADDRFAALGSAERSGAPPATSPSPPNSVGLRWSTRRRFDPSSSPSASKSLI
jgi:hypothetical protein